MENKIDLIINAMKEYFGKDQKRINHALDVLKYSNIISEKENCNKEIVYIASILHDIGIHMAEKKYNSTGGQYQEIEGPPIAKDILKTLGYPEDTINEVCEIIAHHHTPGKINTDNFQILYESDWLVNLGDDLKDLSKEKKKSLVDKNFKTKTGIVLAEELYLK